MTTMNDARDFQCQRDLTRTTCETIRENRLRGNRSIPKSQGLAILITVMLVARPVNVHGQTPRLLSIDDFLSKQIVDYGVPGLAVGIIKDKQVILKRGYGVTSLDVPSPVTHQTVFPILSCTKAFTSAAIGMLVDDGKLDWNDKIIEHIPGFNLGDP